jgi:hypothetical protein
MPRFSIKALVAGTAITASYLGFVLSIFRNAPMWMTFIHCAILYAVIIACCGYQEIKGDK